MHVIDSRNGWQVSMKIRLKRAYDAVAEDDGHRALVDGMWPRGVAKADAALDEWCKHIAPSKELVKWFDHRRARWPDFRATYWAELESADAETLGRLCSKAADPSLTLIFAAKDTAYNNAIVLKEWLESSQQDSDRP
ncbi:DUF488 domain-containing protein [Salinisphaera orenii]|uniref:DUF488 domain-containing protein n=1 Tax=Salinisphaera orenii TaxID=856731 RepID=UPI00296ECB82